MVEASDDQQSGRNRNAIRAWLWLLAGVAIFLIYPPQSHWARQMCDASAIGWTPLMRERCALASWVPALLVLAALALCAWPMARLVMREGPGAARPPMPDRDSVGGYLCGAAMALFMPGLIAFALFLTLNPNLNPYGTPTPYFDVAGLWARWHLLWPVTALLFAAGVGAIMLFGRGLSPSVSRTRMRGADIIDPPEYLRRYRDRLPAPPPPVEIVGVPFPPANERLHLAISASTGAGKTVSLRSLLASIQKRGDRAIILDNNSEFLRAFRRPTDLVIAPFDPEFPGWRLANEALKSYDWERLAESFVPQGGESAREWHGMAKALFGAIGEGLSKKHPGSFTNDEFQWLLTEAEPVVFGDLVRGTTAAVLAGADEHNARRLQSVRMTSSSTSKPGGMSETVTSRSADGSPRTPTNGCSCPIAITKWGSPATSSAHGST